MRKIYQSAPDVSQGVANKATEIIERHFTASGVRRAEDLPEESKVHLLRELQHYFETQKRPGSGGGEGAEEAERGGVLQWILRRLRDMFTVADD